MNASIPWESEVGKVLESHPGNERHAYCTLRKGGVFESDQHEYRATSQPRFSGFLTLVRLVMWIRLGSYSKFTKQHQE
jgi:hypothetical protein